MKLKFGVPTVLINNAAIDSPPSSPPEENGPFEEYPESSWDKVMSVNLKGVHLCCQVFGGAMALEGRGSIINISSIYGVVSPDQNIRIPPPARRNILQTGCILSFKIRHPQFNPLSGYLLGQKECAG